MRKQTCLVLGVILLFTTQAQSQNEKIDMATLQKIRDEGLQHSHVMDIAFLNTCAKTTSNR